MCEKIGDKELCELLVEVFRLEKLCFGIKEKLKFSDEKLFSRQMNFSFSKIKEILKEKNYIIYGKEMVGQVYDIGQRVNAINIGEFSQEDRLIVAQVLEPVIINEGKVLHYGKVMLKKEDRL